MNAANSRPAPAPVARRLGVPRIDLRRDGRWVAIALAVLLVLDVAAWFGLVRPVRRGLGEMESVRTSAEAIERRNRQALDSLRSVHDHVMGVQRDIGRFYEGMLSTKEERLVPFQNALVQVGREFNVVPEKVAVGYNELEDEGLDALAFSFPLTGGYENLRRFLDRLETLDQFVIVREVGLTGAKEGGQALQLNVVVETYFNAPELRKALEAERAATRDAARRPGVHRTRGR